MNVTTAVERALLLQAGLELSGRDFSDDAEYEIWSVSPSVDLAVSSAECHFIVDGEDDTSTSYPSVAMALRSLHLRRAVQPGAQWGTRIQ